MRWNPRPPSAEVPVTARSEGGSRHAGRFGACWSPLPAGSACVGPAPQEERVCWARPAARAALLFACLIAPRCAAGSQGRRGAGRAAVASPRDGADRGRPERRASRAPSRQATAAGGFRSRVADVDPIFPATLFAYEDRRFRDHHGVDVRALFRAAYQLVTEGRPISGASTITMQVARLLSKETTRSVAGKLHQILMALALERRLSKDEILDLYLTLAPYGGNIEGIRAASLAYLGKEPRRLTPAEAALLVALPQAPESRRPDRHADAARAARDRVLERAEEAGVLTADDVAAARQEKVPESPPRRSRCLPPHTAERVSSDAPAESRPSPDHRRTRCSRGFSRSPSERAASFSDPVSVAILVADHQTGEILASVGSSGLFDERRDGFVDMTRAVRSPGSTLKPLDLRPRLRARHRASGDADRGQARRLSPATRRRISTATFHGTVTLRRALQLSLNVPAIELLEAVGPARLVARMRRAGADPRPPRHLAARPCGRPRRRRRDADRPRCDRRGDRPRRSRGAADGRRRAPA